MNKYRLFIVILNIIIFFRTEVINSQQGIHEILYDIYLHTYLDIYAYVYMCV